MSEKRSYSVILSRRLGWAASLVVHCLLFAVVGNFLATKKNPMTIGEPYRFKVRNIDFEKIVDKKAPLQKLQPKVKTETSKVARKPIPKPVPKNDKTTMIPTKSELAVKRPQVRDFDQTILSNAKPIYPRIAIRRGLEGKLKLRITISSQGEVLSVTPFDIEAHDSLVQSALVTAKKWSFKPSAGGSFQVIKNIVFKIK